MVEKGGGSYQLNLNSILLPDMKSIYFKIKLEIKLLISNKFPQHVTSNKNQAYLASTVYLEKSDRLLEKFR